MPTGEAVGSAGGGGNEIALSFDDGPSATRRQVLDILDRHGAKATFFVVGRNAEANPTLVRRAVESGHEIGNHTWSHASLTGARRRPPATARCRARATSSAPPSATSRCCSGRRTARCGRARTARCASSGMLPVVWSVDTRDYEPGVTAKSLVARVRQALRPGSIILLHDGGGDRSKTVAALPAILDEIARQGYRAVTVTQLLNDAPPRARTTWPAGCEPAGGAVTTAASASTTAGSRLRARTGAQLLERRTRAPAPTGTTVRP